MRRRASACGLLVAVGSIAACGSDEPACVPDPNAVELCDGVDNDCDPATTPTLDRRPLCVLAAADPFCTGQGLATLGLCADTPGPSGAGPDCVAFANMPAPPSLCGPCQGAACDSAALSLNSLCAYLTSEDTGAACLPAAAPLTRVLNPMTGTCTVEVRLPAGAPVDLVLATGGSSVGLGPVTAACDAIELRLLAATGPGHATLLVVQDDGSSSRELVYVLVIDQGAAGTPAECAAGVMTCRPT
ncbi:MAG: putative metal-binding motif-containing protein [Kofleriaceae bacterium]|nr:putative metal-binding motif-containing protein [Kofleriaceae bacterium]MBP6842067.1 putative metal-binding motif-containing protein [Kofleriaceae bacterium]